MAWIKSVCSAKIQGGVIRVSVGPFERIEGKRPKSFSEIGSNLEILEAIALRRDGEFQTPVRLAAGVSLLLPEDNLLWSVFPKMEEEWRNKFIANFGPFQTTLLLGQFRDWAAPGTWAVVDTFIGPLEQVGSIYDQAMLEATEMGLYNRDGWLPYAINTPGFATEQKKQWALVDPARPPLADQFCNLAPYPARMDSSDSKEDVIISIESHSGSIEIIYPFVLQPPLGKWLLKYCDFNVMPCEAEVELIRKVRIFFKCESGLVVALAWGNKGMVIDHDPIIITPQTWQYNINRKMYDILRAIKWL